MPAIAMRFDLGEVATGFSSQPQQVQAKLARARSQIDARLARSVTATRFNSRDLGDGMKNFSKVVTEILAAK